MGTSEIRSDQETSAQKVVIAQGEH